MTSTEPGTSGIARFPHFVVVKGYHMGSKWFEGAFGAVPGCSFFFEFEHCLRDAKIRQLYGPPPPSTDLAPPEATLHYLRSSCGCGVGSAARPPKEYTRRGNRCAGGCPNASLARPPCRASGVSFGAIGGAHATHLRSLVALEPRLTVLAMVRTNRIKHAVSFLRTSCHGELNHATTSRAVRRLVVPTEALLLRARTSQKSQTKVLQMARELGRRPVAHVIVYEEMQRDLAAELARILRAVGAAPPAATAVAAKGALAEAATSKGTLVKAGSDDLGAQVANFDALEAELRAAPCLHAMLVAREPVAFGLDGCPTDEYDAVLRANSSTTRKKDLVGDGNIKLAGDECGGGVEEG